MTDRVAIYTSIYGSIDRLIEPAPQDIAVDWYCFTDDETLAAPGWQIVLQDGRFGNPRLNAKWPKTHPHEVLPGHRWTIWVDANLAVDSPAFAREAIGYAKRGFALFRHPLRYCIYHEAFACMLRVDCAELPVVEQVEHYCGEGYPRDAGLYACGVLVRDSQVGKLANLGRDWLDECLRWTVRDQLAFPVVLRRLGVEPDLFPFHIGRAPRWLTMARYLGLTPGTFPGYLFTNRDARRLCTPRWFPPRDSRVLRSNPWFRVLPHSAPEVR